MASRKKTHPAPAAAAQPVNPALAAWPFPRKSAEAAHDEPADAPTEPPPTEPPPAADRIRAEALDLYTDPERNQVERLAVQLLFDSPFNPRARYDQQALADLAETIRGVGVMQPILVRPIDLDGAVRDGAGEKAPTYEIVFGHRRVRAAKLANVATVPAIVRPLTDLQSAQLQAIENVQRQDLDAFEEAEGYAHYIRVHGVTKDQLAAEIGLSRTHVFSRLKLLNAVPAVREACQAGEIGSEVALLVSRIHSTKLQEKALASLKSNGHSLEDGGKRSYRRIREFLRERFTLTLGDALFDPKDERLLLDAGACTTCPKRTENAPEYQDLAEGHTSSWGKPISGQPTLCTDPDCFEAKKKAHLANKAAALQEKGKTVITGGKARAAISAQGEVKGGYIALKDVKAELAKAKAKGKKGNEGIEVTTVTIQDPRTGKTFEAVKADDLKVVGVKVKEPKASGGRYDYEAAERKRAEEHRREEAKAQAETQANIAILAAVRTAAAGQPLSAFTLQLIVQAAVAGVDYSQFALIAKLHECKNIEALRKKVGQLPADRLTTLALDCALVAQVVQRPYHGNSKPDALLAAAKHFGVDVTAIRKDVSARADDIKTQDLFKTVEETAEA